MSSIWSLSNSIYIIFNFSISDLVVAEGRYHTACHCSFENPVPRYALRGQPISSDQLAAFNAMCDKIDNSELCTMKEFHDVMQKERDDI